MKNKGKNISRVQCQLCGCWYKALAPHIIQTHFWSPDDYREEFDIPKSVALCSSDLSELFTERELSNPEKFKWNLHPSPPSIFPINFQRQKEHPWNKGRHIRVKDLEIYRSNMAKARAVSPANKQGQPLEIRQKIAASLRGQRKTPEQIENMRRAKSNISNETRQRMRTAAKERERILKARGFTRVKGNDGRFVKVQPLRAIRG